MRHHGSVPAPSSPTAERAASPGPGGRITFEDMAARRAERMINVVLALLSTRQFLTAEQIRHAVPGYEADDGTARAGEAFKRMFERDKAELRELGIPLETGRTSMFDAEDGYRIARREYELPPIALDPAEAAAVGLAARLWQSATLSTAARGALVKLRAGGVEVDDRSAPAAVPHVDAGEPGLGVLLQAVRDRRPVDFAYRKSGSDEIEQRTVEPWGVLSWRGRWYLVGHDRDRDATRSFRLSRLVNDVRLTGRPGEVTRPHGVDLLAHVRGRTPDVTSVGVVRLVGPGAGGLRRAAREQTQDGRLLIDYTDVDWLARKVAAAGTSAVAVEPPELVAAVVDRLTMSAGAKSNAVAAEGRHGAAAPRNVASGAGGAGRCAGAKSNE